MNEIQSKCPMVEEKKQLYDGITTGYIQNILKL